MMLGPSKAIDAVRITASNAGKTTFLECMARAFPGAFAYAASTKALTGNEADKFSGVSRYLTECLVYYTDECDKPSQSIQSGALNGLTTDRLDVELKGLDKENRRRIGNLAMVGNDWPDWDTDATGMETRVVWAYNRPDATVLSSQERTEMLSPEGISWLRATVLRTATELLRAAAGDVAEAQGLTCRNAQVRASVAECLRSGSNPDVQALREAAVYTGDAKDFVKTGDLLEAADIEESSYKSRQVAGLIRSAFPHAMSAKVKHCRGWSRIRLGTETGQFGDGNP